jgi:hypothetical protein
MKPECLNLEYTQADIIRFERYLDKKISACWIFCGSKSSSGYGNFWFQDQCVKAHRFAYLIYCGPIPRGQVIMHQCDNRSCCNPQHLSLGTYADNVQDCEMKNRGNHPTGQAHGQAKLTQDQVDQIRLLCAAEIPRKEIAKRFNVSPTQISYIRLERRWK